MSDIKRKYHVGSDDKKYGVKFDAIKWNKDKEPKKHTVVVSAFPGTGKSHCFGAPGSLTILDSDSSNFSWESPGVRHPDFPANYIAHIKKNIGVVDIIFVSSHKGVREALGNNDIDFVAVFPHVGLKEQYLDRFRKRGNDDKFIKFIENNWYKFINDLQTEQTRNPRCTLMQLGSGEFISNRLDMLATLSWGE